MRILVICAEKAIPLHGPSGASAHLRGLSRALRDAGHRVRVATPLDADHRGRWDEPLGVEAVHAAPRRWSKGLRSAGAVLDAARLVRAALDGFPPDLVWERHAWPAGGTWRSPVRRWVELNAPLSLERAWVDGRAPRSRDVAAEAGLLRTADRVLAVSAWLARWAVEEAGCDPDRVSHLPNGVEPRPPGDRDGAREALGLHGPVLGFVGTMKPWHGVERLPRLLDALGPEWTGLVVGSGPNPPPDHPRLRRVGAVQPADVPDLVAAMDVAVAPYLTSAPPWFCPLKVLEYRAAGVPVVATDLGDCRALVGDGGEVVGRDDADAWADAIRRQLDRPRVPWVRRWVDVVADAGLAVRADVAG